MATVGDGGDAGGGTGRGGGFGGGDTVGGGTGDGGGLSLKSYMGDDREICGGGGRSVGGGDGICGSSNPSQHWTSSLGEVWYDFILDFLFRFVRFLNARKFTVVCP